MLPDNEDDVDVDVGPLVSIGLIPRGTLVEAFMSDQWQSLILITCRTIEIDKSLFSWLSSIDGFVIMTIARHSRRRPLLALAPNSATERFFMHVWRSKRQMSQYFLRRTKTRFVG